jgi:hypothetical protein
MPFGYNPKQGESKMHRRMPIMVEKDGRIVQEQVPVISGNGVRGLGRRLLIDRSFEQLEINLEQLLSNKEDARRVLFFFRNGGLTPKGVSPQKVHAAIYEDVQSRIPFLDLLGGVYQGHHFESCAKVGIMIPLTRETYPNYKNRISEQHRKVLEGKELPPLHDLTSEVRYTRRAAQGEPAEDKESMIYGTEVVAAGTYFYSWASVITQHDGTLKAFRALFRLLLEYGYIGGMTGRGHGKMVYSVVYTDENGERELIPGDCTDYFNYLTDNRDDITSAIKSIPELFKWSTKAANTETSGSAEKAS